MKLHCVAPVFPLEPIARSTLGRSQLKNFLAHSTELFTYDDHDDEYICNFSIHSL